MSPRTARSAVFACALVLLSAAESAPQTRLKGRVHTPGDDLLIAREQVAIEGAGQYTTDDHGEFEFDLAGDLKVGGEARFHVYHVNPAIKIQQWIVIKPCDTENGKTLSLPAVGSRPIPIVVLPKGDQRLRSLNKDYSILECIIEEGASDFKATSRSAGPRSSLLGGWSSVVAEEDPCRLFYQSATTQGFRRFVETAYHVHTQEKSSASSLRDVRGSAALLDQSSLARKAAELGFTPQELADALDAWVHSAEDSYKKGLAALYERRFSEASSYISASIPSPPGEFLKRYVPLARAEYEQGHYSAAEDALRKVLALHGDDSLILNDLGLALVEQGKYPTAEPLYHRALAIDEKALGPEHPIVARDLNNLAELYYFQAKYTEAEPLFKRALAIDEKALGPEHPSVATNLNNLAVLYKSQGRFSEAEPLYSRSLAIDEKALGPEHPKVATRLNNLAELYRAQGKDTDAEALYNRALAIDENALGPEHPSVARDLNNLAELYRTKGKYTEAERLFKRALAIDEKALGPEHPNVAANLTNLAGLYYSQGKYADAEPLYKRALTINEKVLGPDHPKVARVAENLAADLHKLGRDAEARVYEDQAAQIRAKKQK